MITAFRHRVVVILLALVMAFTAFASINVQPADAHGNTHYSIRYSAWLAECWYGGWWWYDYYAHGRYYWHYC